MQTDATDVTRQPAATLKEAGGARSLVCWEDHPPSTVRRSPTAMFSKTDVFYIEKQARIYPGGALWLMPRTPFFIVVRLSISPAHVLIH